MKRSPISRKTELKRTEFRRASKAISGKPGHVRKRSRLRRVSKKNSRKHVDETLRRQYMNHNPLCELAMCFPTCLGKPLVPVPGNQYQPIVQELISEDPHHIVSGIGQTPRWDITTNLIALCRPVHEFCETFNAEGIVLCLWRKLKKQELDLPRLCKITRVNIVGWLECQKMKFDFCEQIRGKLLESIT